MITHYCGRQLTSLLDDGIESSFQWNRALKYVSLETHSLGVVALLLTSWVSLGKLLNIYKPYFSNYT